MSYVEAATKVYVILDHPPYTENMTDVDILLAKNETRAVKNILTVEPLHGENQQSA